MSPNLLVKSARILLYLHCVLLQDIGKILYFYTLIFHMVINFFQPTLDQQNSWPLIWILFLTATREPSPPSVFSMLMTISALSSCRDKLRINTGFSASVYSAQPIKILGFLHLWRYPTKCSLSYAFTERSSTRVKR